MKVQFWTFHFSFTWRWLNILVLLDCFVESLSFISYPTASAFSKCKAVAQRNLSRVTPLESLIHGGSPGNLL